MIVVVLSLLAAALYAISDFLEQRAASTAASREPEQVAASVPEQVTAAIRGFGGTLRQLLHDRGWFAGWAIGTLAYGVQAVALYLGSIAVVQALQVTALLFTIPLSAVGHPESPRLRDWAAGVSVCVGLAVFLLVRGSRMSNEHPHRGPILFLLLMLFAAIAVLVVLSSLRNGELRAFLLGVATGAAFAGSATLVKLTSTDLGHRGVAATAVDWPGYALALATGTGLLLQQASFAAGRLATATTSMIVTNPLVGSIIAAVGFNEGLPKDWGGLALIAVSGALVAAGVAVLARSPVLRGVPVPR